MIYAPETRAGQLLQRSGARSQQPAVGRSALAVTRQVARAAPLQVRSRLPGLRGTTARARAGRSRSADSTARWPSGASPVRPRRRQVAAAELALFAQDRWRLGSRVTLELGLRMDREDVDRARELVAARRRVDRRAARGTRHSPRRRRAVSPTHAAQRRRVHPVRAAHGHALRSLTARRSDRRSTLVNVAVAGAANARGRRRQHRVESAIRPTRAVQGQLPEAQRLPRVHSRARSRARRDQSR